MIEYIIKITVLLFLFLSHYKEKYELTQAIMKNPENIIAIIQNSDLKYGQRIRNKLDTLHDRNRFFISLIEDIKKDFTGKKLNYFNIYGADDVKSKYDPDIGNKTLPFYSIFVSSNVDYDIEFEWLYINNNWILYNISLYFHGYDGGG